MRYEMTMGESRRLVSRFEREQEEREEQECARQSEEARLLWLFAAWGSRYPELCLLLHGPAIYGGSCELPGCPACKEKGPSAAHMDQREAEGPSGAV